MPIYEYKCSSCEDTFEVMQSMSASDLISCKLCESKDIRKIIHAVGSIYKGDGFYSTEYRSESYKEGAKKDKTVAPVKAKPSDKKSKSA
ncbi:MAG: FmdB family transcriptional regulator [Candidatus Cloacimonadota bacterium]|nr:MAG: FmdB family transcriptional regulator [Candidatus Cloacimonadota bacterium]